MNTIFEIDAARRTPKYLQIVHSVTKSIKNGKLKKGDRILSINELSNEFFLSRDTVQKAYDMLEESGILIPIKGKGFYINRTDISTAYRVLLLFNRISNYKKQIYNAFIQTLGSKGVVDLKIHHSNAAIFESYIYSHLNEYDYFVIMPHFYENAEQAYNVIKRIPSDKLILLDKDVSYINSPYAAVFQDFQCDVRDALEMAIDLLKKYNKITLVFPKMVSYPYEIVIGFRSFCMEYNFSYRIINEINLNTEISNGEAFLLIEETDLVNLVKLGNSKKLKAGKDIGIMSFNETPLKEILLDGITVISTDHEKMGEMAARLILENRKEKIKNPFKLIVRKSL